MSVTGFLSGGLMDTTTPDYVGAAVKNEAQRKGIINLGLGQINSIFDGGSSPFYSAANLGGASYDPNANYFAFDKKGAFTPYQMKGKAGSGPQFSGLGTMGGINLLSSLFSDNSKSPKEMAMARFKKGGLYNQTTKSFEGFQPDFFNQRAQDYVNNALPQLANQYQSTKASLGYGLANRGLINSSAQRAQMSELDRETGQAKQQLADTGQNQANALKTQVEGARSDAISKLYQTGDPAQATAQAISSAAQFHVPSTFAPISNMFSNLLSQYYTGSVLNQPGQSSYVLPPNYSTDASSLGPISSK